MSLLEELERFKDFTSDQKLKILRIELIRRISTVRAYTMLSQKDLSQKTGDELISDLSRWLEEISRASEEMDIILNEMTRSYDTPKPP